MIRITGLNKKFGKYEVLKSLDLTIDTGKVTAIVGPNGSGKTTLIKLILGLVKPSGGKIEVDGEDISNNFLYRNKIGYMPQIARYPDNLSSKELFSLVKELRTNPNKLSAE